MSRSFVSIVVAYVPLRLFPLDALWFILLVMFLFFDLSGISVMFLIVFGMGRVFY